MERSLLCIIFFVAALTVAVSDSIEAEEYVRFSENVTCETGGKYYPVGSIFSSLNHQYSCDSTLCHCDPDCVLFEDCCPDYDKVSSNSTSTRFDKNFIPYTTCSSVHEESYMSYSPYNFSVSSYLISKCPAHVSPASLVRQYCEDEPTNPEDIFITPIAVEGIGHFKNLYCAACHDMNPERRDIEPWTWAWSCADDIGGESFSYDYDSDYLISQGSCMASFRPRSFAARYCLEAKSTCSGDYSFNNEDARVQCPSYLAPYKCNDLIYKNLECAYCNGFNICEQENTFCEILEPDSIPQPMFSPSVLEYFRFSPEDTVRGFSCFPEQIYDPSTEKCEKVTTKVREDSVVNLTVCLIFNAKSLKETFVASPEDSQKLRDIAKSLILESQYFPLPPLSVKSDDGDLLSCQKSNGQDFSSEPVIAHCTSCLKIGVDSAVLKGMNVSSFCSRDETFNHTPSFVLPSLRTISVTKLMITLDSDCEISKSLQNSPGLLSLITIVIVFWLFKGPSTSI